MKIIGILCVPIAGLFLLPWALYAVAQESCPPWAQERSAVLRQQAFQLGIEIQKEIERGGHPDFTRLNEINQEMAKLPKECVQQGGNQPDPECSQKVHDFNQCGHEFNKKVAAGLNPTYTCVPPKGCFY